jgi:hypothetical protein
MTKISPLFLKASIHIFHRVFCDFLNVLFASADSSLFMVLFKVLHASRIIAVEIFFKKSPQKDAKCRKVSGSWWPKFTPDNAKQSWKKTVFVFAVWFLAPSC